MTCEDLDTKVEHLRTVPDQLEKQKDADLADAPSPAARKAILDRYHLDLMEAQTAINAAEEALWTCLGQRDVQIAGHALEGLTAFDRCVQTFMRANGVRRGQLCILNQGHVLLNHAYTCAVAPPTQTRSLFRVASCSKAFTRAALRELRVGHPAIGTESVFPLLGIDTPAVGTMQDARLDEVTVDQLEVHRGGWDGAVSHFDPVFRIRDIAIAMGRQHDQLTKHDIARFMYGRPLDHDPGTVEAYSNFGYLLLGLVIEQVSGQTFVDFLRTEVLQPLGLGADVFVAPMLDASPRNPLEVGYDQPGTGPDAVHPSSPDPVPLAYGGEGFVTELMDSGGGLMTTANTLARFAHVRAAFRGSDRTPGSRSGSMAGTSSRMTSRGADIDYAWIFNTRAFRQPNDPLEHFNKRLDDLFDEIPLPLPSRQDHSIQIP